MSRAGPAAKRFVVDVMLGRLAKWLRVLGFDALLTTLQDCARLELLISEGFTAVTRRERLRDMEGVIFIHSDHHLEQLNELISVLDIGIEELRVFSRCGICNSELLHIASDEALGAVPDYIFETSPDFRKCPKCRRVYWAGSHKKRMIEQLESATGWKLLEEREDGSA